MDLYPCTLTELKSIGYTDTRGVLGAKMNNVALENQNQLPRPDFSQMIPYKPKKNAYHGEHPLAGGCFPQPPALSALCAMLPPPVCFRGPFVSIDQLIDIFNRIKLPDREFIYFLLETDNRNFSKVSTSLRMFAMLIKRCCFFSFSVS